MKTLLIYDKLVTLHREAHRHLKLAPQPRPFDFARETNSVLLAATELPQAVMDMPCVFIETEGQHALAALVGLRDHENLLVQDDGTWQRGAYVPAFVRRYPFVLAETAGGSEFTVCLDQACPGLNADEGQALFEPDGSESAWLDGVKTFLVGFRQEMEASREFANALAELGLLQERAIEYELQGQRASLSGFKTVDEAKLRVLPPAELERLLAKGWLGLVYAHLLSLNQVQRLALRLEDRLAVAAAPAAAALH